MRRLLWNPLNANIFTKESLAPKLVKRARICNVCAKKAADFPCRFQNGVVKRLIENVPYQVIVLASASMHTRIAFAGKPFDFGVIMRTTAFFLCLLFSSFASAQSTVTSIVDTPIHADAGASVTLTGVVTGSGNGAVRPLGSLAFFDGASSLASGTLASRSLTSSSIVPQAQLLGAIATAAQGTLAVADFNGDGRADVISYGTSSFQVFLRNSSSTGLLYQALPAQNYSLTQPVFTDFNGDGSIDIISNAGANLNVLAGNGQGTFAAPASASGISPHANPYTGPASFTAVASAAISGSTYLFLGDRVIDATEPSTVDLAVSTYRNNGSGGYTFVGIYPITAAGFIYPSMITGIQTADIDGDGKQDLLVTVHGRFDTQSSVYVVLGYGDGSLHAPSATLTPTSSCQTCGNVSIVTGDFNGDSKQDVALTASTDSRGNNQDLYVYAGNGDGTFASPLLSSTVTAAALKIGQDDGYFASLAVEDLDGDGKLDLVDSMGYGYLSKGDLTFTTTANLAGVTWTFATAQISGQVLVSDFNQDGLQDLYFSLPGTTTFHNAAAPTFVLGQNGTIASIPVTLTAGTHNIVAKYSGLESQYSPSTSDAYQITVVAQQAVLTPSASPAAAIVTQPVNLVVKVAGPNRVPTGTVTFLQGSNTLGTASLDASGTASLSYLFSSVGTQSVTVNYSGDSYTAPSSSVLSVNTLAAFTAAPADGNLALASTVGGQATASLEVNPQNGFTGNVSFACTGLPAGVSCTFSPATVNVSSGSSGKTTLTVNISNSYASQGVVPFGHSSGVLLAALLVGGIGFASQRKRLTSTPLLVLGMTVLLGVLCGCGSDGTSTATTTPAKTSSFNVVANSGSVQVSTPFTLKVQ